MAGKTLRMLLDLVKHAPVATLFLSDSLCTHSAHIVLHLLTQMLSDRGKDTTRCSDVRWRPNVVLVDLLTLATSLARTDEYVKVRT